MRRALGAATILLASTAWSQAPAPSPAPAASPSPAPLASAPPDLEIRATVRWKELKFETVGTPRVEFSGTPARDTVWEAERENLPKPVQPGVVYKDGGIRLTIHSSFADLARLFAELDAGRPVGLSASPSPSPSPSPSASAPPASPNARWVYGLFSQADAAAFDAHTTVLEEMANSLTLERPKHYTEERNDKMAFLLRVPPSWKSSRSFSGNGTYLQQWTSPALAAEKGQPVPASLTLNVEPAPGDGTIDTFYTSTLQKLGEAYTGLSHHPWGGGYADVMHSETQVAVTRSKRFLRVADGRGYSLVCDGRDDVYGRVVRWCDMIATTLRVGSEAGRP